MTRRSPRAESDPGLPIKLAPCSNGEFAPGVASPIAREAARRARATADELAPRLGMSRREFLLSSMGFATTLLAIAACNDDAGRSGGTFTVPPESTTEPEVATSVVGAPHPVIDVQTHLLEWDPADERSFGNGFPQGDCGEDDPRRCFSTEHWLEEVFERSDTTMAVLSAVPVVGEPRPLSEAVMTRASERAEELCGDGRVLIQGHAVPNIGDPTAALEAMEATAERYDLAAWKTYTHAGPAWRLDDDLGERFLALVERVGPPVVAVHKGLSGREQAASPADIGPAARAHPDIAFCVYHSAFERGVDEGPYTPGRPNGGVDRLVETLRVAQLAPGANVYAELGSTWRTLMASPTEAAHVLGKLLLAVGEDNILWGTDSIWYGSPQDQIAALRAFTISDELQERHGYPALTDAVKEKILWRNAARVYGVDPADAPCRPDPAAGEDARRASPHGTRTWGPTTGRGAAALFAAEHPWFYGL